MKQEDALPFPLHMEYLPRYGEYHNVDIMLVHHNQNLIFFKLKSYKDIIWP